MMAVYRTGIRSPSVLGTFFMAAAMVCHALLPVGSAAATVNLGSENALNSVGVSHGSREAAATAAGGATAPGGARHALSSDSLGDAALFMGKPEQARDYLDGLLADPVAARTRLCGNFTKRSKTAVVFTCYERMDLIHRSLPSVLRSEGILDYDVFISQDGITTSIFDDITFSIPSYMPYVHIHHPVNLCTGLHMHFVKAFAFDIMGYDILLIVEEDNVVHPQGLQLLARMAELSTNEPDVGLVSLLDMDMSPFLDSSRFNVGIMPVPSTVGHLWVFGMHRIKYDAVRHMMDAYYNVIKGNDYRFKHEPPLRDRITALMNEFGFPVPSPFSQDRFFLNSLAKAGFTKRYQTLFRFFEPIGMSGLHSRYNATQYSLMYGHHMYGGLIDPKAAFDVTKRQEDVDAIRDNVRKRLTDMFQRFRKVNPSEDLVADTTKQLFDGRLNGQFMARGLQNTLKPAS